MKAATWVPNPFAPARTTGRMWHNDDGAVDRDGELEKSMEGVRRTDGQTQVDCISVDASTTQNSVDTTLGATTASVATRATAHAGDKVVQRKTVDSHADSGSLSPGAIAAGLQEAQQGAGSEVLVRAQEAALLTQEPKPTTSAVRPEHFSIELEIGVGAFGRVTKVRHGPTRREFAMKAISKKLLRRKKISQAEWRLERDVLVRIEPHPYVVELVCAFQTNAYFFLVMKYLPGGELFAFLRSRGTFPEDVAAFYTAQVALALEHLHASGVIHRDLKPENLLLDADGHVVVTDFGLAKMCESSDEVHRTLCGTDVYMAPEMVARRAYGKAVDFWSLGVLVFEMLTGKTPFAAPTTKELHRKILTEKVKFPPYVNKDAISCLRGLLERQVPRRLGATKATMFEIGGLAALKAHAFFGHIEWQPLARRECPPPLRVEPLETRLGVPKTPPKTLDVLAAPSAGDTLSKAPSEVSDDASTVIDFEFCREGIFEYQDVTTSQQAAARGMLYDSPTSSQCDLSSVCTEATLTAKKKKGPRKRKKKMQAQSVDPPESTAIPAGAAVPRASEIATASPSHQTASISFRLGNNQDSLQLHPTESSDPARGRDLGLPQTAADPASAAPIRTPFEAAAPVPVSCHSKIRFVQESEDQPWVTVSQQKPARKIFRPPR